MLVIPKVRPEDSGKYECRGTGVQTGHVAVTSAQVIVNSKPDNSEYNAFTYTSLIPFVIGSAVYKIEIIVRLNFLVRPVIHLGIMDCFVLRSVCNL